VQVEKIMARAKKTKRINLPKHHHATYRAKRVPVRVAHHTHTGKRLPFYCTSYAILFFLIAFTSLFIAYISHSVSADQQSGGISLIGINKGVPPEIAAGITKPKPNERFNSSKVEIAGTCLEDKYVEIYRNDAYAGTAICDNYGTFSLTITLTPGPNELVAKTRDAFEQYGPDSATVLVYYDQPNSPAQSPSGTPGQSQTGTSQNIPPPMIYTQPVQKGARHGKPFELQYEINGGKAPYAVSIDWGDNTPPSLYSHEQQGDFTALHVLKKSGQLIIGISLLGAGGYEAYIQTIVIVEGNEPIVTSNGECINCFTKNEYEKLVDKLWLPVSVATLMTGSFWLGEKIMYSRLRLTRA
jgi:hypothetical protein